MRESNPFGTLEHPVKSHGGGVTNRRLTAVLQLRGGRLGQQLEEGVLGRPGGAAQPDNSCRDGVSEKAQPCEQRTVRAAALAHDSRFTFICEEGALLARYIPVVDTNNRAPPGREGREEPFCVNPAVRLPYTREAD